jgi:hypothetical protein
VTEQEIRAAALQAAARVTEQNFKGGGHSKDTKYILWTAATFEKWIKDGVQ